MTLDFARMLNDKQITTGTACVYAYLSSFVFHTQSAKLYLLTSAPRTFLHDAGQLCRLCEFLSAMSSPTKNPTNKPAPKKNPPAQNKRQNKLSND